MVNISAATDIENADMARRFEQINELLDIVGENRGGISNEAHSSAAWAVVKYLEYVKVTDSIRELQAKAKLLEKSFNTHCDNLDAAVDGILLLREVASAT